MVRRMVPSTGPSGELGRTNRRTRRPFGSRKETTPSGSSARSTGATGSSGASSEAGTSTSPSVTSASVSSSTPHSARRTSSADGGWNGTRCRVASSSMKAGQDTTTVPCCRPPARRCPSSDAAAAFSSATVIASPARRSARPNSSAPSARWAQTAPTACTSGTYRSSPAASGHDIGARCRNRPRRPAAWPGPPPAAAASSRRSLSVLRSARYWGQAGKQQWCFRRPVGSSSSWSPGGRPALSSSTSASEKSLGSPLCTAQNSRSLALRWALRASFRRPALWAASCSTSARVCAARRCSRASSRRMRSGCDNGVTPPARSRALW
mmetsp:Transcript_99937/g.260540  ORF Transcript_99937/g.260540 Transcript_99937/m.260540 type:complete len:323 (+) Transcript_99937:1378-2346(+)